MRPINLVWFRRDLRLRDNEIVWRGSQGIMLPFFIIDPWFYQQPEISAHRVQFLLESLADLDQQLQKRGSQLYVFHGHSFYIIQQLTRELLAQNYVPHLFFSRDIQVTYGLERDQAVTQFYRENNLRVTECTNFFLDPNGRGDDWLEKYYDYQNQPLYPTPERLETPPLTFKTPQITLADVPQTFNLNCAPNPWFKGGESQAQATLTSFLEYRFQGYHWKLSRPWLAQQGSTSHLSPHLTFGTISSRQVYQAVQQKRCAYPDHHRAVLSLRAFRDRLRWRDSASQRLYDNPHLVHQNLYPEFDDYYTDEPLPPEKRELFWRWQQGLTGFPLVDASMRQLRHMGWMNFRMRAMCATFLTINCGISWHHGARHYMQFLIDGDLAIDHWQWQSQAGITNPLSPSFRIYNPERNARERDENWQFIHYWVPELRAIRPEDWGKVTVANYPPPMLDWSETRQQNGLIIQQIRERIRQRLHSEGGLELQRAQWTQEAIKRYHRRWKKYYEQAAGVQQLSLDLGDELK
ncbi:MAG: FAD-binding domain-containing protein [Gloeomargarita sp. SKYBB_i_bin120]|nr:deoxyribodipyrimidine photo-lyase [Gloeomargarita sp. SKYG98]MCS7293156.1 deoxyribodipyrimidine photo-lyase [Gloeomargarita sp. SKYB120]MDW8178721.1 FAD-binding domain-containing protein [Gloeomargarita sp. SKYBB_i_bin120]